MEKQPGSEITLKEFEAMKNRWQEKNPDSTQSVLFGNDVFKTLLKAGGSGVRIHFGLNEDSKLTVMMTPENAASLSDSAKGFLAMDRGQMCPPYC